MNSDFKVAGESAGNRVGPSPNHNVETAPMAKREPPSGGETGAPLAVSHPHVAVTLDLRRRGR